ncbi:MAG: hypothetical protein KM312_03155 [Hydrogenibacillus schlegelii]|uniref:Uncharacterized protein n=1 Tax=Hydrogenibacillus schlegelii TaxID=1484 RepID=A0A947CV90_HYDSH|nr:hypothetical protein [Hydrogenibacillus schlegelii]
MAENKDAIIVEEPIALEGVTFAFGFQGQKCFACSRAIVVDGVYDRALKRPLRRPVIEARPGPSRGGAGRAFAFGFNEADWTGLMNYGKRGVGSSLADVVRSVVRENLHGESPVDLVNLNAAAGQRIAP